MLTGYKQSLNSGPDTRNKLKFIDVEDHLVGYYTGGGFEYYKQYAPKRIQPNIISFPVERCDPLPIDTCGSLRYFFISAIEGQQSVPGQPFTLKNPEIDQLVAVRGKATNGHWSQVYIGFNSGNAKVKGNKLIYSGIILVIQYKDTKHVENRGSYVGPDVKYLDNNVLGLEVKMHLENPQDWNWKSPIFHQKLQELLGPLRPGVIFNEQHQSLLSHTCYWTKDENKLKGIKFK